MHVCELRTETSPPQNPIRQTEAYVTIILLNGGGEVCEHDSPSGKLLKPTSAWLLTGSGEIFLLHR